MIVKKFMKWKACSRNSIKGMTLVEILVSTSILVVVSSIVLSSIISFKKLYAKDVVNVRANQELRGVFDVISSEVRLLGANLPAVFPALLLQNGASGAPDVLTLRRNLLEEVLLLCQNLTATSADRNLFFSYVSTNLTPLPGACGHSVNANNFNVWGAYLAGEDSGEAKAYIFDASSLVGEYLTFESVENLSVSAGVNQYRIFKTASSGNWQHNFSAANASVYLLEEWRIQLDTTTNILQLVDSNDPSFFMNIANNITDFQVRVEMQDGTIFSSFTSSQQWQEIRAIEITLEVTEGPAGSPITRSWTSKYLPRNVISVSRD